MTATRLLLLGGTSEIGLAIVRELSASQACEVVLAGRSRDSLDAAAQRLQSAGRIQRAEVLAMDALQPAGHRALLEQASGLLGGLDVVILAVGLLGQRGGLPEDVPAAVEVLEVNVAGAGSLLLESARSLAQQRHGTVIVLSSVAAERARGSNAVYCASKAGLDALAQGLREDLIDSGVRVMIVRPGFVRTRMTAGLTVPPLACDPRDVARATARGLRRREDIVWPSPAVRLAALALRLLPRPLLRRLPL